MRARSNRPARWLAVGLGSAVGAAGGVLVLASVGWSAAGPWIAHLSAPSAADIETNRLREEERRATVLRARVQPRVPQRAFDLDQLRARSSISAEAEVQALLADLRNAREHHRRGAYWEEVADGRAAADRLALFRWRFGVVPQSVSGWTAVELEAVDLLAEAARNPERRKPCEFCIDDDDSYASLLHALLLELAGRIPESDERLAVTQVTGIGCGNCSDEREGVISHRREEAAVRRGDAKSALKKVAERNREASFWGRVDDFAVDSVFHDTWRGVLLLANGRAADGVLVLQQVVDLFPDAAGAEIARGALEQVGALVEPTAERLLSVYVDAIDAAPEDDREMWRSQRRLAIRAYGAYRPADAFERLLVWFDAGSRDALEGLIDLRSERARQIFELELDYGELGDLETALRGLAGLNGGIRSYVDVLLVRLDDAAASGKWFDCSEIDEVLRTSFHGGPAFDGLDDVDAQPFVDAWRSWIAADGSPR